MITREEAKDRMDFDSNAERLSTKRNNELIDIIYDSFEQHIKSLEAQLANTEQPTCESCRYFSWDGRSIGLCHNYSQQCPNYTLTDFGCIFHKPKDTQ